MPAVSTLGEARAYGWKLTVRCAGGKGDAMKKHRACVTSAGLDLETLVWTRGLDFPLGLLGERMKCPRCGSRRVRIVYEPPDAPVRQVEAKPRSTEDVLLPTTGSKRAG